MFGRVIRTCEGLHNKSNMRHASTPKLILLMQRFKILIECFSSN